MWVLDVKLQCFMNRKTELYSAGKCKSEQQSQPQFCQYVDRFWRDLVNMLTNLRFLAVEKNKILAIKISLFHHHLIKLYLERSEYI